MYEKLKNIDWVKGKIVKQTYPNDLILCLFNQEERKYKPIAITTNLDGEEFNNL